MAKKKLIHKMHNIEFLWFQKKLRIIPNFEEKNVVAPDEAVEW